MFAEELKGNTNRKRQEQARERRRRAKEQQLKQDKEKLRNEKQSFVEEASKDEKVVSKDDSYKEAPRKPKSVGSFLVEGAQSNVVSNALEQRKLRSFQKAQNAAALVIQSTYRSFKCVCKVKEKERDLLEKRMRDLETLVKILNKQKKTAYVPPTSLANALIHQILALTHTTPRLTRIKYDYDGEEKPSYSYFSKIKIGKPTDVKIFVKILEIVLLPSILSSDPHLNLSVFWFELSEGRMILRKILRLSCHVLMQRIGGHASNPFVVESGDFSVIAKVFKALIGMEGNSSVDKNVTSYCKNILLSQSCNYSTLSPGVMQLGVKPLEMESLDLIHILRSFLLYPNKQSKNVVPSTAYEAREKCIQQSDKERGNHMFEFTLKAVMESNSTRLQSRFFAEIFSVPLLLWKIESTTISKLVHCGDGNPVTQCVIFVLIQSFIDSFEYEIERGLVETTSKIFPTADVPFNLCPVPSVLSMFANCIQLGHVCPFINGNRTFINYDGK